MKLPHKKWRAALVCAICAAALALPAWAAESGAAPTQAIASDADSAPDNGALFYGYLLQCAGAGNEANLLSDAGSKLSAKDRELYDALSGMILKIAAGEETSSILTITYDDFQKTWTAEELGVSSVFSPEGEAALDAKIEECWSYDTRIVLDALLADFPYELYWYDKAEGIGFEYLGADYSGYPSQVTITSVPSFTVSMSVSQDYMAEDGEGYLIPFVVDRAVHKGIRNIVSTAAGIVDANKGKSDYDKMLAYAVKICDLVEYDDAAAGDPNLPYGDPWQIISVFDGDPATNVVCEGYAKAFQYLCDLSAFSGSQVESRIVSGTLDGGTGEGAHMWNVVTMGNGKNYMADLTNSDDGGKAPSLFLKGGDPDNAAATSYTFYLDGDPLGFLYDEETIRLWGMELLTLDKADYQNGDAPQTVSAPVQVRGCSLTLVDDIALNFCLSFDAEVTSDSGAYVMLTGSAASDAQMLPVALAPKGTVSNVEGAVCYFTAHMPAKRMNDKITLACYGGDGKPLSMRLPDGAAVTEFSYCVQDYLSRAASEPELQSLAEAMSAYGYYAQKQFGYNMSKAAAPSASFAAKVRAVSANALAAYAPKDSGSVGGVSAVGDSLTLEAAVTQRFVFSVDGGSVSGYAFTLDGQAVMPKSCPEAGENAYCVEIPGVAAKDMDKPHTLTVSKGAETLTHKCSTLSYAYKALSQDGTGDDLRNLIGAMYLYHKEAKAYLESR